jgi:hypothetical protein
MRHSAFSEAGMNLAEQVGGRRECSPPMKADADGAGMEVSVTLGELVEAVGSLTEDVTELVTVVSHMLHSRRATWAGPTSAGKRMAVASRTPRRLGAVAKR